MSHVTTNDTKDVIQHVKIASALLRYCIQDTIEDLRIANTLVQFNTISNQPLVTLVTNLKNCRRV